MKLLFIVGIGSFIGGSLRYILTQFVQNKFLSPFPYGTFLVNIIGCFLIGIVVGLNTKGTISMDWRLFLATGILGGFTTFSAFSLETVFLMKESQYIYAFGYAVLSVLLGLVATFIGIFIAKSI